MYNKPKTYTIRISYAGFYQYIMVYEKSNNFNVKFTVEYYKGEIPSFDNVESIDDIIMILSQHVKNPELIRINGWPLHYYNSSNMVAVDNFKIEYDKFLKKHYLKFYKEILEPIFKEKNYVLYGDMYQNIGKQIDGELTRLDGDEREEIYYLIFRFMRGKDNVKINIDKGEHNKEICFELGLINKFFNEIYTEI